MTWQWKEVLTLYGNVQFVLQTKENKIFILLMPVNTTEYYDSMALVKRQDKNIFLDWEIFMHDTES